ncbi:uncharacterized protein MYCGRDRAFT_92915 [Zymoseptoria tritici IPO323]|uniref:Uncharacterized protein n=1 Tax=Zymoseptoria tritici (strain CBS 115943 / IPO323) TaxID=336722 RepID=F9X9T2_ZYMTI|nr:uncharacterized protein MYCGRDRAFT_92915 [Zymoseptoria tritici IPO323]EGP88157.1 hypothetical protein MYCGRDRAFT_92915 [Zymoseptoria tritici IPO323]
MACLLLPSSRMKRLAKYANILIGANIAIVELALAQDLRLCDSIGDRLLSVTETLDNHAMRTKAPLPQILDAALSPHFQVVPTRTTAAASSSTTDEDAGEQGKINLLAMIGQVEVEWLEAPSTGSTVMLGSVDMPIIVVAIMVALLERLVASLDGIGTTTNPAPTSSLISAGRNVLLESGSCRPSIRPANRAATSPLDFGCVIVLAAPEWAYTRSFTRQVGHKRQRITLSTQTTAINQCDAETNHQCCEPFDRPNSKCGNKRTIVCWAGSNSECGRGCDGSYRGGITVQLPGLGEINNVQEKIPSQ